MHPNNRQAYLLRDLYRYLDLGKSLLGPSHPALDAVYEQIAYREKHMIEVEISFAGDLAEENKIKCEHLRGGR